MHPVIYHRKTMPLLFVDKTAHVVEYLQLLKNISELFIEEFYQKDAIFELDGSTAHRTQYTRGYFLSFGNLNFPWHLYLPDMNV